MTVRHLAAGAYRTAWILMAVLSLAVALAAIGRLAGYRLLSVQTDSMQPAIGPGDAVLVRTGSTHSLKPGHIISYRSIEDPRVINTHRVVAVDSGTHTMTTRGDHAARAESGIPLTSIVGGYQFTVPYAGYLLDAFKHPLGLLLAVYLPVLCIAGFEIQQLTRYYSVYSPRRYSLYR